MRSRFPHALAILPDGSQADLRERCVGNAVKACDTKLLRHPDARLLRILQRAEGDHIIAAKERIRRFAGFRMREQLFRKGIAAFTGERAMAHEPIIRRKPIFSSARV